MYKHILIPTDGSGVGEKAVAAGIDFARDANAKITWFTAVPEYQPPSEAEVIGRAHIVSIAEHDKLSREHATQILDEPAHVPRLSSDHVDPRLEPGLAALGLIHQLDRIQNGSERRSKLMRHDRKHIFPV